MICAYRARCGVSPPLPNRHVLSAKHTNYTTHMRGKRHRPLCVSQSDRSDVRHLLTRFNRNKYIALCVVYRAKPATQRGSESYKYRLKLTALSLQYRQHLSNDDCREDKRENYQN